MSGPNDAYDPKEVAALSDDALASAVEAAVYLHGLSADFAVREQDEHTLLATDVVSHLFEGFHFRPFDPAGYVWLQGLPGSRPT